MLGFAAMLASAYSSFEQTVAVGFTPDGRPDQFMERNTLFYLCVAIFLINNTLVSLLAKLFPRVPDAALPVPNQAAWAEHRAQLNELTKNWFYALMATVNTVMILALWVLSQLNKQLGAEPLTGFGWLLPVSVLLIAIAIIALPVRLLFKPDRED